MRTSERDKRDQKHYINMAEKIRDNLQLRDRTKRQIKSVSKVLALLSAPAVPC